MFEFFNFLSVECFFLDKLFCELLMLWGFKMFFLMLDKKSLSFGNLEIGGF